MRDEWVSKLSNLQNQTNILDWLPLQKIKKQKINGININQNTNQALRIQT